MSGVEAFLQRNKPEVSLLDIDYRKRREKVINEEVRRQVEKIVTEVSAEFGVHVAGMLKDASDKVEELLSGIPSIRSELAKELKGEKGDTVVGPAGAPGVPGRTPVLGIDFTIPEAIPGPRGLQGEPGLPGVGIPGLPGKDGSSDTPEQIAEKLNTLKEVLAIDVVRGLRSEIESVARSKFGGGSPSWIDETPSGLINSSNVTFTLSTNSIENSEIVRVGGAVQERTEDYTFTGRTITFIVAPTTGVRVRVKYQKR